MTSKPLVSIIVIDYKKDNPYLVECLDAIQKQIYSHFEIILITDYANNLKYPKLRKKSYGHYVGPAEKRDIGAKLAKGDILAFIDDDAYPSAHWLESITKHFKNPLIAGVGGPGVTPANISWQEEASGWASASPVGAGPYTYRFSSEKRRFVDDYPSMNLAVRKSDFEKVGGYDSDFWPGEDTKLCLDLTHKLNKQIVYDPKALVYHHRRPLWRPHLRQNGNFGLHRGFFARILPQTSFKPVYFLPSILLLGLLFLLIVIPAKAGIHPINSTLGTALATVIRVGSILFLLYISTLFFNALWVFNKSKNAFQAALSVPVIFITHLWYGTRFLQGFLFTRSLPR